MARQAGWQLRKMKGSMIRGGSHSSLHLSALWIPDGVHGPSFVSVSLVFWKTLVIVEVLLQEGVPGADGGDAIYIIFAATRVFGTCVTLKSMEI